MRLKEEKMKEKLAINGGIPIRRQPFPSRIMFNKEEERVVAKLMEKALEDHMTLYIYECWTEKEIEDTLNALKKVEKVYSIKVVSRIV